MKPKQPAIFLDRDGTIIKEVGYLKSIKGIRMIPRADDAIRIFKDWGYKVVVVSNQSGVARGYFDESVLGIVNDEIIRLFHEKGAEIDAMYYCPHHPDFGSPMERNCDCRKPHAGMLYKAEKELNIDLKKSVIIGDKRTDVETGNRLGIISILVLTGFGKKEYTTMMSKERPVADFVAEDIYDAIHFIGENLNPDSDKNNKQ
jgi:D-glycero-D-manno-heptose 1,7-bisphosphate phosphatase